MRPTVLPIRIAGATIERSGGRGRSSGTATPFRTATPFLLAIGPAGNPSGEPNAAIIRCRGGCAAHSFHLATPRLLVAGPIRRCQGIAGEPIEAIKGYRGCLQDALAEAEALGVPWCQNAASQVVALVAMPPTSTSSDAGVVPGVPALQLLARAAQARRDGAQLLSAPGPAVLAAALAMPCAGRHASLALAPYQPTAFDCFPAGAEAQ
mmetsp:Transcript_33144/g.91603  ORF Transcript_33144/g.91603 Transcript_33144/m.91603 type:complete len:208 (+) Transcript_33144:608-1231(+)